MPQPVKQKNCSQCKIEITVVRIVLVLLYFSPALCRVIRNDNLDWCAEMQEEGITAWQAWMLYMITCERWPRFSGCEEKVIFIDSRASDHLRPYFFAKKKKHSGRKKEKEKTERLGESAGRHLTHNLVHGFGARLLWRET